MDRYDWIKSQCGPNDKIVDIGCQDGHIFQCFEYRDNVTNVDIDLYDIWNFVRADAQNLPFKDKEFDIAVLAEILEHVPDPVKALKEAARVANKVVITVPNEYEWNKNLDPLMTISDKEKKYGKSREVMAKEGNNAKEFYTDDNYEHLWHIRFYKKDTFDKDLKSAGFTDYKIEDFEDCGFRWFVVVVNTKGIIKENERTRNTKPVPTRKHSAN